MKIKEVCTRTGLTEKAVRLYIENGLIHPHVETGTYRNSYTFSEEDIKELDEISVFRKAGFSLFEISLMKEMPEKSPELLEKKMSTIALEIEERKNLQEAISRLQVTELASSSRVANALKPAFKDDTSSKEPVFRRSFLIIGITIGIFIFFIWLYFNYGMISVKMISSFLCILIFLCSGFMSFRYGTCTKRAKKLLTHGKGMIVAVTENHGFDASFANAGSGGAGTREPGIGGMWQIFFLLWSEVRPDCWYPVILYEDEAGKKESASVPYGSFKNTWTVGDEIEISWDDKCPMIVFPLDGKWIVKKALIYGLVSITCLLFAMFTIIRLTTIII